MTRQRTIYWLPRALGMVYLGAISLFALDIISAPITPAETLLARAVQLLPALLFLVILGIAWQREWPGGFLFFALGIATCIFFGAEQPQTSHLLLNSPLFLIGALFWLCALCRRSPAPDGRGEVDGSGGQL